MAKDTNLSLQGKNASIKIGTELQMKARKRIDQPRDTGLGQSTSSPHSLCEGSRIMEMDASGKLSSMPFNILNAELNALALIPRSPSKSAVKDRLVEKQTARLIWYAAQVTYMPL